MKRLRRPKLEDGELCMYWGRQDNDCPDVIIAWQGDSAMKRDSNLLHYAMCSPHVDPNVQPLFSKMRPSLVDDLKERGYDITTIKFSIKKLPPPTKDSK